MDTTVKYVRPGYLEDGEKYLCRISPSVDDEQDYTTVTFVSNTACPAIVVVQDVNMVRIRCNRMDLFIPSKSQDPSNSPPSDREAACLPR